DAVSFGQPHDVGSAYPAVGRGSADVGGSKRTPPHRWSDSSGAQMTHHRRGVIMSDRFTRLNIALMLLDETRFDGDWSKLLSPREREVGLLVARGLTNKEVGRELCLSEGTIKQHIHNIFVKLADAEAALGPLSSSSRLRQAGRLQ